MDASHDHSAPLDSKAAFPYAGARNSDEPPRRTAINKHTGGRRRIQFEVVKEVVVVQSGAPASHLRGKQLARESLLLLPSGSKRM